MLCHLCTLTVPYDCLSGAVESTPLLRDIKVHAEPRYVVAVVAVAPVMVLSGFLWFGWQRVGSTS